MDDVTSAIPSSTLQLGRTRGRDSVTESIQSMVEPQMHSLVNLGYNNVYAKDLKA